MEKKNYSFIGFIDCIDSENKVLMKNRIKFNGFTCGTSLKDALYHIEEIIRITTPYSGYRTFIGISSISCNGKQIDWNYKNRVIFKDAYLKERFWC